MKRECVLTFIQRKVIVGDNKMGVMLNTQKPISHLSRVVLKRNTICCHLTMCASMMKMRYHLRIVCRIVTHNCSDL